MVRDGLRVLLARDRIIEDRLNNQVDVAYDALSAYPSRALADKSCEKSIAMKISGKFFRQAN